MKTYIKVFIAVVASFFAYESFATDIIYGGCHYKEWNGRYAGFQKAETYATFLSNDEVSLVYCLRMPKAAVSGVARLTPKITGDVTLNVTLSDCETGEQLLERSVTFNGTKNQEMTVDIMPEMNIPSDTWYRLEIKAPEGYRRISRLATLEFERTGNDPVCDAHLRGFPTPATHLWFGHSTEQYAPQDESYEWCYQEVLMPVEYQTINTYLMTLGITGGYMGIQLAGKTILNEEGIYTDTIPSSYTHQALFSIWDNGDTDLTPDLAKYLQAGALSYGPGVKINHFGAEGTGCQAMITNAKWNPGQWVQFLTLARPEEIDVTLKNEDGTDRVIKYPCSLLSAWYKTVDDPEWHYMATIRHSGESHYWNGWYSFIENWADSGGELFRRAYYRNNYQRSNGSGRWYFVNKASFSQTTYQDFINSGEITVRQRRMDYGHGLAGDVPRAFYMQTGGYGQPKDSLNTLPLVEDHSCVENINLDSLKLADVRGAVIDDGKARVSEQFAGVTKDDAIMEKVDRYISLTNRFGGYAAEDMASLIEMRNDPEKTPTNMKRELMKISRSAYPLGYGNTLKISHVSSFKAYQLRSKSGFVLTATPAGLKAVAKDECDVTDPCNNWIVQRHDDQNYYCMYNIGTGLYLAYDTNNNAYTLSDRPHQITLGKPALGFTIKSGTRYVSISSKGVLGTTASVSTPNYFELLDNYYMTPETSLCEQLLADTTPEGIAAGIDEVRVDPFIDESDDSSLSQDIVNVRYYDTAGRRVGYALQSGQAYVAYILLKNGATMVRKITVK